MASLSLTLISVLLAASMTIDGVRSRAAKHIVKRDLGFQFEEMQKEAMQRLGGTNEIPEPEMVIRERRLPRAIVSTYLQESIRDIAKRLRPLGGDELIIAMMERNLRRQNKDPEYIEQSVKALRDFLRSERKLAG
ncbi:unnamed protein product [Cyprideis torosa]|uniref:Uncharacterized protein n=1 Tax=Cyprideis torosa TaxID=163714 RepID=A0A7R8ZQK5_9CRUS|nr:unnamed protein product [Cyprideis torosa]CAG0903129.1 unnamed protein product [Cyprideis torosa]